MTLSIPTVKKEIRILGLDTCRKNEAFGAIVRGGLFLDGAVRFALQANRAEFELAREILATRYYPELRAIMLHDPQGRLRPTFLGKHAGLPIIVVAREKLARKSYPRFQSVNGTLFYRTFLTVKTAEKIFSLTWTRGAFPEPARVAHLIAKSHPPTGSMGGKALLPGGKGP